MFKVFCGNVLKDVPIIELLRPNFAATGLDRWAERYVQLTEPVVELVNDPNDCDAAVIPHNYNNVRARTDYLAGFADLSKRHNKKVIIFFPGDSAEPVTILGLNETSLIVFRNSVYRSSMKTSEIVLPGYVADLGKGLDLKPRYKSATADGKPVVGFCGWAGHKTFGDGLKFWLRNLGRSHIQKQGIWWRKNILRQLSHSSSVKTNFIIRRSYSGNEKTLELDPEKARQEYVSNILGSDFTLCVKGDGNFSTRFYEVLSLGRMPLYIDTDSVLPLEDVVKYEECVVKVPWQEWMRAGSIAADFYKEISESAWLDMQIKARQTFEKYLRFDSFLAYVFKGGYIEGYL